jgi:MFS family permease
MAHPAAASLSAAGDISKGELDRCAVRCSSRSSERGLDWFTFFVADIQTGFGPFLAVYLTTQKWTQADIGLVLAFASIAGLASQLPGGWLVDAAPSKRRAAMWAVGGIGASALLIALWPSFLGITAAKLLHVASSSVVGPAISAITLGLVGHAAMGPRLGRNARFGSAGNGIAAAAMGAFGYLISPQAVFYVTAILALPTLLALASIREREIDPVRADGGLEPLSATGAPGSIALLLRKQSLIVLAGSIFLFHAANAAMLPLVGSEMTLRSSQWASALVAVCIVGPQLVAALIAPGVGRLAVSKGRRPVLLAGFAALPVRAMLLAWNSDPIVIVAVQMLDGVCAAVLGVLVPLSLADISRGTGRFNLAQGIVASATGFGAALSTTAAGYLADRFGVPTAFLGLGAAAICAFVTVLLAMPETAPGAAKSSGEPD